MTNTFSLHISQLCQKRRFGRSEEEVTFPPERRRGMQSSLRQQRKTRLETSQSGKLSKLSGGNRLAHSRITTKGSPASAHSSAQCSQNVPAAGLLAYGYERRSSAFPPNLGSGLFVSVLANTDRRAPHQLQWRDRTGFTPDFLFSPLASVP